jgi:hypothetical protein
MIKKIIPTLALLAVIVTACGGQPAEPTLSPEEVQGTAISAAFTMVAQTQAAIPTNTPLPPTETPSPTPLPTFTALPSPTLDFALLPTATQAASSGGGTCAGIINLGEAGPQSRVRFENDSGGTVGLSIFMYAPNLFGQCGSLPSNPYTIAKNGNVIVSLPKGSYYAYGWITYGNDSPSSAEGYFINKVGDDHLFPVRITKDRIVSK